ncbi:hypothetical protein [Kineothrix alysoides]|nr:hypothetical protein [Kineothrix alysoides]
MGKRGAAGKELRFGIRYHGGRIRMKEINKKLWISAAIAVTVMLVLVVFGVLHTFSEDRGKSSFYSARGFSNMCAYEGVVYRGVNGVYGESIPQQSSIFTIQEDKIYYVEKVQEAYEGVTDELLSIKCSDMNGSNVEVLAKDVFLAGMGHEKLLGDKLFYGYEYDDSYRMRYAYVDLNTGERKELKTDRIDNILGYDGRYVYYNGYDGAEEKNILGRIYLKNGKDETLTAYSQVDEVGYIDGVSFYEGKLYCLTLVTKPEGYDYRTYEYQMQVRSGESGKVERELPISFTGSANYSFLIEKGKLYASLAGKIVMLPADGSGEMKTIAAMKADEYWGILHFVPGDGYLYYEAIAQVNEETQNNDYFYRVPIDGGESELLNEWFII